MSAEFAVLHWGRFSGPTREWGVEASTGHLGGPVDIDLNGLAGTFKQVFRSGGDTALFGEFGAGMVHLSASTRDLATQTNFQLFAGIGAQLRNGDSGAWQVQYRFQHISNADREYPNTGINNSLLFAGYVWYR